MGRGTFLSRNIKPSNITDTTVGNYVSPYMKTTNVP